MVADEWGGVIGDSIRRAGRYDFWRVECDMELDRSYTADVECVMHFRLFSPLPMGR